jgi:hypothetical protein
VNSLSVGLWENFDESNMKVGGLSGTGTPIRKWTINAGLDGLNKEELDDVLILLTYITS